MSLVTATGGFAVPATDTATDPLSLPVLVNATMDIVQIHDDNRFNKKLFEICLPADFRGPIPDTDSGQRVKYLSRQEFFRVHTAERCDLLGGSQLGKCVNRRLDQRDRIIGPE